MLQHRHGMLCYDYVITVSGTLAIGRPMLGDRALALLTEAMEVPGAAREDCRREMGCEAAEGAQRRIRS